MIGDRKNDEIAARNVRCDFIWCTYGHIDKTENIKYNYSINSIDRLLT